MRPHGIGRSCQQGSPKLAKLVAVFILRSFQQRYQNHQQRCFGFDLPAFKNLTGTIKYAPYLFQPVRPYPVLYKLHACDTCSFKGRIENGELRVIFDSKSVNLLWRTDASALHKWNNVQIFQVISLPDVAHDVRSVEI